MSEEKLEEKELAVENFLDLLNMDVDLIMLDFLEVNKRIEQADKIALDNLDKNEIFELGEKIGIIKGYMKILSMINNNINKIDKKEIITEMIKNLDLLSSILINFSKNDINKNDINSLEQRMLMFADSVLEFLEDILRK
jgi:hypothetical protein